MSRLTSSSPTRDSSWAMSSSKSGFSTFGSLVSATFSPPEVWAKLGSLLVTKSSGLSASLLLRTPVVSQMAVSLSVHSVMKAASS